MSGAPKARAGTVDMMSMKTRIALATALAALTFSATADAAHTPRVSTADARQYAQEIATNLGGGTVARCERQSRYIVRCRADLDVAACHVWAKLHAHHGFVYWVRPRAAYCDDGSVVSLL